MPECRHGNKLCKGGWVNLRTNDNTYQKSENFADLLLALASPRLQKYIFHTCVETPSDQRMTFWILASPWH